MKLAVLALSLVLAAAGGTDAADEEDLRALVERFVAAQNAHDARAVGDLLWDSPQFLWITRGTPIWGREAALKRFDLVRAVIHVSSVEHKLLDKNVGLIKIKQFSSTTSAEVAQAMDDMKSQGATAWVLDLRWNPGGLLEESVEVVDLFVDSGAVVTTVSNTDASR